MDLKKKTHIRNCLVCHKADPSLSYFKLPLEESRRQTWLEQCNIPSSHANKSARICSNHFTDDAFPRLKCNKGGRRRLKRDAIPSINIQPVDYNKEETSKSVIKTCFLCGRAKDDDPQRSYHRFPKNVERQNEWMEIIGRDRFTSNTSIENLRLCNLHFSPDDILESLVTKKQYLKTGAVPIKQPIVVPGSVRTASTNLVLFALVNQNGLLVNNGTTPTFVLQPGNRQTCDQACQTDSKPRGVREVCADFIYTPITPTPSISQISGTLAVDHSYIVPSEVDRTLPPLRYTGDIRPYHYSTPEGAERCFLMCKKVIESQRKKIIMLSKKLRHQQKKVERLENMIQQLF